MAGLNRFAMLVVLVGGCFVVGCAGAATAEGMTVRSTASTSAPSPEIAKTMEVDDVEGGRPTHWDGASQIDNAGFKGALTNSLREAGLLANKGAARYNVVATLVTVEQPTGGIDMTVISKIRYKVTDAKSGKVVFQDEIAASYTAHLGDAVVGATRLRLATEGSARKNIGTFIEKLQTSVREKNQIALAN